MVYGEERVRRCLQRQLLWCRQPALQQERYLRPQEERRYGCQQLPTLSVCRWRQQGLSSLLLCRSPHRAALCRGTLEPRRSRLWCRTDGRSCHLPATDPSACRLYGREQLRSAGQPRRRSGHLYECYPLRASDRVCLRGQALRRHASLDALRRWCLTARGCTVFLAAQRLGRQHLHMVGLQALQWSAS